MRAGQSLPDVRYSVRRLADGQQCVAVDNMPAENANGEHLHLLHDFTDMKDVTDGVRSLMDASHADDFAADNIPYHSPGAQGCGVVPMPNHDGKPVATMLLAYYVMHRTDAEIEPNRPVVHNVCGLFAMVEVRGVEPLSETASPKRLRV